MSGVPLDKYLQQSGVAQLASPEAIQNVVSQMIATAFQARDEQLQAIVNQVATKLQQLEAAIGQVALAAQQTKLSPFEVALKALPYCSELAKAESTEARCYDKSYAVIEHWLDASLATSEAGSGDAGRAAAPAREAEAEAHGEESEGRPAASASQAESEPADND